MNLMPLYRKSNHDSDSITDLPGDDPELEAERKKQATLAGRLGPRGKLRYLRPVATRRQREATSRKANQRHRRQWLARQEAISRLKGQIMVAEGITPAEPALQRNVMLGLVREFGEEETLERAHAALEASVSR